MDCSTALTPQSISAADMDVTFTYNQGGGTVVGKNINDLFINADSINCPVTSCVLKTADCSAPFTSSYITIAGSTPWAVSAVTTVTLGWVQ